MLILGSVLKTCSSGVDNEGSRCNRQITGRALVRLALRILGRLGGPGERYWVDAGDSREGFPGEVSEVTGGDGYNK
jgi:hypothetical protein